MEIKMVYNRQKVKLGDIADVKLSNVDKKTKPDEREIKLCNYTDVYKNWSIKNYMDDNFMVATCNENEFEKFILKKGQVAITKDSETPDDIGVSTYIAEDFENVVLGYHLALIAPFADKLDGQFLNYYFHTKHLQKYFENNAGGSGQRYSLSIDTIKEIPLFLPSLKTQTAIARILSSFDDKIELNNKINKELENLAKTIYEYWFVQNAEEKWEKDKLENICERIQAGGTPSRKEKSYFQGDISKYTTGELGDTITLQSVEKISEQAIEQSQAKIFPKGSILIAIYASPTAGKLGILSEDGTFNQAIAGIVPKGSFSTEYIFMTLLSERPKLLSLASGTAQKNLSNQIIKDFEIAIPPSELLKKFNKTVSPLFSAIIKNRQESDTLAHLRDFLLPMLMNGQVKVNTL
jgi:type I restriction enzyme S subunit